MFDKTIIDSTVGIVGLRQPLDPTYAIIDTDNLASRSGYFVTDLPLVKVQYFKDCQDFEDITDSDFNTLLKEKQKSSISSVCSMVFIEESFRDRNVFYANANNNTEAETLIDGFVGFKIEVNKKKNIAFEITRVILDFQGNFGNIELQLYNTGDPNPIQTQTITITEQHQVVSLNWVVNNSGDTYKGDYYLGYVKSSSTPIPFKRNYNNSNVISNITDIDITPMQVKGHSGNVLFNLDNNDGLSENIGINPDVLVYDDYTDFILQNQRLFGRAVQLEMGISILSESMSSLRVNRNQRISDGEVLRMLQTLDGIDKDNVKVVGLRDQLIGAISSIKLEIDKLRKGYFGGKIKVATLI